MNLKPQDIVVAMKLVAVGPNNWTYNQISFELGMSPSEVHSAVKRLLKVNLVRKKDDDIVPNSENLQEFLEHGIQYAFAPDRSGMTRGLPTAYAAPPLSSQISKANEPPPVWPDPEGEQRGVGFSPLHKSVPSAARKDSVLYQLLVIVDALRGGGAREKKIATRELEKRLKRQ
ncbi:MAG: helix-turn-helix domain-containing protein [Thermodesulfobacteriota bacterium]